MNDWPKFSTRAQATTLLALYNAALKAVAGVTIIKAFSIVDGLTDDEVGFVYTPPYDPNNPLPGDTAIWQIEGVFGIAGTAYTVVDNVGGMVVRETTPNPAAGDSNYKQVGWGPTAQDVAVPAIIAFQLFPTESYATGILIPA